MYGQNHEDDILLKINPSKTGYFVDIGAYHSQNLSNSRCFAELGWKVFMLEMNPFCVCGLLKDYKDNPNVEIMYNAIIEDGQKEIVECYLSDGSAVDTIFSEFKKIWEKEKMYNYTATVHGITCTKLAEYLKTKSEKIDIISIDVEGNSHRIAMSLVDLIDANCYIVEHDHQIEKLKEKFESCGYKYYTHTGENIIFTKI